MSIISEIDIANKLKNVAGRCFDRQDYGLCFANLLAVLKLNPSLKEELKCYFATVLCAWGRVLVEQNRYSDLFTCYESAIEVFPENELVVDNLGAHLLRFHHYFEAQHYFKVALKLNHNYLPAYRNLQNVNNCLVERWHYRMLNDTLRNEAFRKAIHKKINLGFDSVLDIGTGSGLLSLYAMEGGAKNLYACDYSKSMIDIAKNVISSNFGHDCIKLFNKLSDDLIIPEDIPCRLTFIVTETVDAGLLGEHILQTVFAAWTNILLPQDNPNCILNQRVVPHSAFLIISPIECSLIANKNQLFRQKCAVREHLKNIDCINFNGIVLRNVNSKPYDTENLKHVAGHFKFLSDSKELFYFDFNDPSGIKKYIFEGVSKRVSFECTSSGYFDAMAVWFNLNVDNDIILSTSPENNFDCCWDQAIFPNHSLLMVETGTRITLDVICKQGKLSIDIISMHHPSGCNRNRPARNNVTVFPIESIQFDVSESIIKFLNCELIMNALINVKNNLYSIKKEIVTVLDLSPFPILGLSLAAAFESKVVSFVREVSELEFISQVLKMNSLRESLVECKFYKDTQPIIFNEDRFDVIVPNLIHSRGELNEDSLYLLKEMRSQLKCDALIIPQSIDIWCQLIHSEWLYKCSTVQNKELEGHFKVAQYINEFKVTQWIDLHLKSMPYLEMSEKFCMCSLTLEELCCNDAIFFEKHVQPLGDLVNAVIYWFEFDIAGSKISTFHHESYVNQAAELFFPAIDCRNESLKLKLTYNLGIIRFELIN